MKRIQLVGLVSTALLGATVGCGDNSKECGEGTEVDDKGFCVPTSTGSICGDGTKLNSATNTCEPDTSVCGSGTVLVDGKCQDPTSGLMVDLEEGPEPNGFEMGATPAGNITLKAVGGAGFVIHGCIKPVNDVPDLDDFTLTVTGPTLIKVTADGINGLAAGFVGFGDTTDPAMASWQRFGLNVTTDMSRRQLYLPKAGTYDIVLTDTRTLLPLLSGGTDLPPAGDPSAESKTCYYVTIDQQTPAPVSLNSTTSDTGTIGEDLKFYTATALGEGFNQISGAISSDHAAPSVVVLNNNAFRKFNDGQANTAALSSFAGIKTTDTPLIVLDYVYNYAVTDPGYIVSVTHHNASTALSRTGGTVMQTELSDNPGSLFELNTFYYDVTAADEIDGFNLSWNQPVDGLVLDENGVAFANFTFDPDPIFGGFFGDTFAAYKGLLRHRKPGRYYFSVYDPNGTPGTTSLVATSQIVTVTPVAVTEGTVTGAQTVDAVAESNAFTYAAGTTDAWQQFNATGTATGALTVAFFNPSTAYGRLDAVTVVGNTPVPDATPVFTNTFAQAGVAIGRVLLDDGTTNYLTTVNTATVASSPTFTLDFKRRDHDDLGTIAVAASATRMDQLLDTTTPVRRYLLRTAGGNRVTATLHPDNVLLDPRLQLLNNNESVRMTSNSGIAGADDTVMFAQTGNGWTALTVSSNGPLPVTGTNTFDLSLTVQAPINYTVADTTTPYVDACTGAGSMPVVTAADTTGSGPLDDEGLSVSLINTPAGFDFFGFPAASFRVSTNGLIGFTDLATALFSNKDMPLVAAPNSVVAPYWDDLYQVAICQKTVGTKLVIQWEGLTFLNDEVVAFQVILDGANDTIEFVYDTSQAALGAGATIGIEDPGGANAKKVGFNTDAVITAGAGKKFTPM